MSFIDGIKNEALEGAKYTVKEINQQPELWKEAFKAVETNKESIESFLNKHIFS